MRRTSIFKTAGEHYKQIFIYKDLHNSVRAIGNESKTPRHVRKNNLKTVDVRYAKTPGGRNYIIDSLLTLVTLILISKTTETSKVRYSVTEHMRQHKEIRNECTAKLITAL